MADNFFRIKNGVNLGNLSADPANGTDGDTYYNTTSNTTREYVSGSWRDAVQTDSTQTLTNKTFGDAATFTEIATPSNPASTFHKIYPKSDGSFYTLNSSGTEVKLGSGGGSGSGKNYLTNVTTSNGTNTGNGDFEFGSTTGWSLFNTTGSGVIPTGTISAGASSITTFTTVANVLGGKYALDVSASSGFTAFQGFITDSFYIDTEDQAKVLTFKFYYDVLSGNTSLDFSGTSSNTFAVYIYDVTNSAWIQPAGVYGMTQLYGAGLCTGTFQTTSNSTQYRLAVIAINSTASVSATRFDDFSVGPQTAPIGAPVTDWQADSRFSMSSNFNASSTTIISRRVGDSLEVRINFVAGTPSASQASINLSGIAIDSAKLPSNAFGTKVGMITIMATGANAAIYANLDAGDVFYDGSTTNALFMGRTTQSNAYVKENASQLANSNGGVTLNFKIPIAGWSSNVQMSNDTDTRVTAASYQLNSSTSISGTASVLKYTTQLFDSHAAYDTGTGVYTVAVSGIYRVSASYEMIGSNGSPSNAAYILLYKNGSEYEALHFLPGNGSTVSYQLSGETLVECNAGDQLAIYVSSSLGTSTGSSGIYQYVNFERLSGPSVIAATESVNAKYNTSTTVITSSATTIVYTTKEFDSHNAFNTSTGTYTIPVSGKYRIGAALSGNSLAGANSDILQLSVYKNGLAESTLDRFIFQASVGDNPWVSGSTIISAIAGDAITIKGITINGLSNVTADGNATNCYFSIERIGN